MGRAHRIVQAAGNAEPPRPTERAFTVVVCGGCGTEQGGSLADTGVVAALREVVRQCPFGILVTVPCMFGAPCPAGPAEGVSVVLQPCTSDREPTCSARLVGPIRDPEDIAQLSAWVRAGRWNVGLLPLRLRRNAFHTVEGVDRQAAHDAGRGRDSEKATIAPPPIENGYYLRL